jgi:outer membrane protein OmpA-like peptidoglycan-associated protein
LRKLAVIFLLFAAGTAAALPSFWGVRGINRVSDARTFGSGKYSIGFFGELGISSDTRTGVLPTGVADITNTEFSGTGRFIAGIGFGSSAEMGLSLSYLVNQMKRDSESAAFSGDWEGDDGLSEARVSLKYNFNPASESSWFSLMPWASFAVHDGGYSSFVENGDGWDGIWHWQQPMFELRRPMINSGSLSWGADFLASFDLKPAVVSANLGYHRFSQNFQFTDSRYDASHNVVATQEVDIDVTDQVLRLAAGIEYPIGSTTLFAEVDWHHFLDRNFDAGNDLYYDDHVQVSPGVRFNTTGMAVDLKGSFTVSSFDPQWSDLGHGIFQAGGSPTEEDRANRAPFPGGYPSSFGLGINVSYVGDLRKAPAVVSGRIYDASTGEALMGTVSSSRQGVTPASATAEGMYTIQVPAGSMNLNASAEGYIASTVAVDAASGSTLTVDFPLERIQTAGVVSGTVTDASSGAPLSALVTSGSVSAETDSEGFYSMELAAGSRNLNATAAAYAPASATVDVPAGGTATRDFQLELVVDFDKVYFDLDSDVIRRDARTALDDIAAFLLANPGVTVTITGNTCDLGDENYNQDLGNRRAQAVRSYLISKGVSDARLATVSYGESRPDTPNTSEQNRSQNRRAEFVILGR